MSHDIGLLGRAILRREANRARHRATKLRTLHNIGTVIASSADVDKVLTRVVEAAVFISNAEEGSLLLLDEGTDELYLRAQKGLGEKYANGYRIRVEDSIAGEVVRTGTPQRLVSQSCDLKVVTGYMVNSIVYVPVCGQNGVIGALSVDNQMADEPFSDDDEEFLVILAGYAALSLENARRIEELERRSEAAAARNVGHQVDEVRDNGLDHVNLILLQDHAWSPLAVPFADRLLDVVNLYLSAAGDIQRCIDELEGKPPSKVRVAAIGYDAPVVATVEGIREAAAAIRQVVSPQRRYLDEVARRLLVAEKEVTAERARIEMLEARARLNGNKNGDEWPSVDVINQVDHLQQAEREYERLRLEAQRFKIGLACDLVAWIAPHLAYTETVYYVVRLLPALDQVLSSPLEVSTGQLETSLPEVQEGEAVLLQ